MKESFNEKGYCKKYSDLTVTIHTKRSGKKTGCNYRYLVHYKSMSHTAFRTKEDFQSWLYMTGLKLGKRRFWLYNTIELIGTYYDNMLLDEEYFEGLYGEQMKVLSNGDYTLAKVTNYKGNRVINYLNPNCKRKIFDYRNSCCGQYCFV